MYFTSLKLPTSFAETCRSSLGVEINLNIIVAALSKARVCGRSVAGTVCSNHVGGMGVLSLVNVVCFQLEVSASGWAPIQGNPTECGLSVIVKP
jgi:hypothetical protein